jgi:Tol biopolymer transport system component
MTEKIPFSAAGLILVTLLILTAPVPAIQGAPPAQEGSNPSHPRTESREDLPYLDLGRRQPESPDEAAISQVPPWSKLVFQSFRDLNDWDIWAANGDGSGQFPLTDNEDSDIHPRLNRGASRVVFASNRDGDYEILVTAIGGSGPTRLTRNTQDDVQPSWSPDATKVTFESYRDGQAEVYVMNADGSGQTRLTWHADYDGLPTWSPDGTRIAFTSRQTGGYRIWVMNADGSSKMQRSAQPYSENPAWSPDGSQIAYDSDGDGDGWQELWLMNADGTNQHMVYDPGLRTDAWARSWSPDGRYVAFTRISFIEYQGNWYWTEAYLDAWDSASGGWVRLSNSGLDWRPDWQTTDITPPISQVDALPGQSPAPILVRWSGSDAGPAGIKNYDVQIKEGTEGAWTDWQRETTNTSASYPAVGGQTYHFRCRARDYAGNVEPWPPGHQAVTTVETLPPKTAVDTLPAYSRGEISVSWGGWDPGGSSIQTYDVQTRDEAGGGWTDWHMETTDTSASFSGTAGHTVYFRARARDSAHNLEDWPAGDGDAHTTFYAWGLRGTMRDNADTPVAGAMVTTTPEALAVIPSDIDGAYAAFTADGAGAHTAAWGKDGYGVLPATQFDESQDAYLDVILPPIDNVLLNWGFESGVPGSDWLASGVPTPTVTDTVKHTGGYAALLGKPPGFAPTIAVPESAGYDPQLAVDSNEIVHVMWQSSHFLHGDSVAAGQTGDSSLAQAVTIPTAMDAPILSFLYLLGDADSDTGTGLNVQVENGVSATTLFSSTTNTSTWAHRWFDLTPWAGQMVTLTFSVHEVADYPTAWAYLDEITLGSAYPDPWVRKDSLTDAAIPDEHVVFALTYGNRGGAPSDSVQITDELPPEISFKAASPPPTATTPSLVWDAGDLPAGSGPFAILVTATMSSTAPMWSSLTNTVTIETTSPELETANNVSQAQVFVGRQVYLPLVMKGQ